MKYVVTIKLKKCFICKMSCGPKAGQQLNVHLRDGTKTIYQGRQFICFECQSILKLDQSNG